GTMMTDCADLNSSAASSTEAWLMLALVGPAPATGAGAPAESPVPNAPNSTLANERFMALLIITLSRKPDVPSSAPAMISTLLSSAKPVAAAASPADELSSDTTTGMSAPPMGSTNSTPSRRPTAPMARKTVNCDGSTMTQTNAPSAAAKEARFMKFW